MPDSLGRAAVLGRGLVPVSAVVTRPLGISVHPSPGRLLGALCPRKLSVTRLLSTELPTVGFRHSACFALLCFAIVPTTCKIIILPCGCRPRCSVHRGLARHLEGRDLAVRFSPALFLASRPMCVSTPANAKGDVP